MSDFRGGQRKLDKIEQGSLANIGRPIIVGFYLWISNIQFHYFSCHWQKPHNFGHFKEENSYFNFPKLKEKM